MERQIRWHGCVRGRRSFASQLAKRLKIFEDENVKLNTGRAVELVQDQLTCFDRRIGSAENIFMPTGMPAPAALAEPEIVRAVAGVILIPQFHQME